MREFGKWRAVLWPRAVLVLLGAAYMAMYLESFPRVYIDEPWESIPAYQLCSKGVLNDPVLTGRTFDEEHLLAPRLVQTVVLGAVYRIFGPGLLVGRLTSLVFALGTVWVFGRLLRLAGCSAFHTGLAIALLCVDNFFFVFARLIRPEIVLTCLGLTSFYFLYQGITRSRLRGFAWAGGFSGIGAWTHPNYLLFLAALLLILVYEYRLHTLQKKELWIFLSATLLGLSPYLVYLWYQDAGHHFSHLWAQVSDKLTQGEPGFWVRTFGEELDRYRQYVFFPYRVPVVLFEVFFLCLSFRFGDRLSRFSQIVIFAHLALFPLLVVSRSGRYFLPVIPFIVVLIVRGAEQAQLASCRDFWVGLGAGTRRQRSVALGVVLLLVYQAVGNPVMIWAKRVAGYGQLLAELRQYIPPQSRVWGSMMFWFGFTDCQYRTQYTFAEDLYRFKPEYVIIHDNVIWRKTPYISVEAGKKWDEVTVPVERYTAGYGELIGEIPDTGYGELQVWKVDSRLVPDRAAGGSERQRPD